jgi:hypothetical protein
MEQQKLCHGCSHAHDCQRVYEQLGRTGGPSVAGRALLAFVLPVLVFVTSLTLFRWLLEGRLGQQRQLLISLVSALIATTCFMWVVSRITKRTW